MKFFAKLKKFFKKIVDAFKELFASEEVDGPIDIEVVTETTTDADGNQTIIRTERVNTTPTWKEIFGKAKRKVMEGIDNFIEHPVSLTAKIGAVSAFIAAPFVAFRTITDPIKNFRENHKKKRMLYNDRTHLNYQLKRPLTKEEINEINAAQERKENITELLNSYGVLY